MATSLMDTAVGGLLLVGTYRGITTGDFPKLVVEFDRQTSNGPVATRRELDFRAFSPTSGEQTRVGKEIDSVKVGDRVAVGVFTGVRSFRYKSDSQDHRKGDPGQMVTFDATSITPLGG
jgi:hypothetical protein